MNVPNGHTPSPLRALIRSEPLDRPPILLWKHFRIDEPYELARRTVRFYRAHRLAAAKLMPDIPLLFADGALSSWSQLAQLRRFGPIETVGRAAEYVRTVELVRRELDSDEVVLVTLFSPLALIGLWCGPVGLRELAEGERSVAHAVLWALAGVVNELAAACCAAGADGVYYSCWGQDVLSSDQYAELGVPYDLAGLRGATGAESASSTFTARSTAAWNGTSDTQSTLGSGHLNVGWLSIRPCFFSSVSRRRRRSRGSQSSSVHRHSR